MSRHTFKKGQRKAVRHPKEIEARKKALPGVLTQRTPKQGTKEGKI